MCKPKKTSFPAETENPEGKAGVNNGSDSKSSDISKNDQLTKSKSTTSNSTPKSNEAIINNEVANNNEPAKCKEPKTGKLGPSKEQTKTKEPGTNKEPKTNKEPTTNKENVIKTAFHASKETASRKIAKLLKTDKKPSSLPLAPGTSTGTSLGTTGGGQADTKGSEASGGADIPMEVPTLKMEDDTQTKKDRLKKVDEIVKRGRAQSKETY